MNATPELSKTSNSKGESPLSRSADPVQVDLLAIVVAYKMQPVATPTLISLIEAAEVAKRNGVNVRIYVADNTPGGQTIETLPPSVSYRAYPENPGLVLAYNNALAEAERSEIRWLLTLDQDTHLPLEFLSSMAELVRQYDSEERVAAIVPRILDGGRRISPFRFLGRCLPRVAGQRESGLMGRHASALNSASLLRVAALRSVGGYDEEFPLNNSDTAVFHRLDKAGFRIVLAGDVVVHHELAIMRRPERMTLERYRQLLRNEREFWDLHMNFLARTERLLRLAGRGAKAWFHDEDVEFQRVTLEELRYRLLTRRSKRTSTDAPVSARNVPSNL